MNVVFLLNLFILLYMQNTIKYLHNTCCGFYVVISTEANF